MTEYDLGKVVGDDGADGNGIASISKTGTSGLVDTYTITYDDGDSDTFTVTNGADGQTGATGNGIASVTKTGTSGLVDTYTITFTNGNTTTFTVTNGSDATVTIVTSWSATTSDSKVPSEKLSKTSLDGKLDNAVSSTAITIASNDNILVTDYSDSNKVKRVANILASQVKDSNAHSNIGTDINATQYAINYAIDTALGNKVSKSSTTGLLKNDGSVDTSAYITSSAITGMLTTSDIANNLTTTTTGKVLDASQGKALADLIGQAISYINQ